MAFFKLRWVNRLLLCWSVFTKKASMEELATQPIAADDDPNDRPEGGVLNDCSRSGCSDDRSLFRQEYIFASGDGLDAGGGFQPDCRSSGTACRAFRRRGPGSPGGDNRSRRDWLLFDPSSLPRLRLRWLDIPTISPPRSPGLKGVHRRGCKASNPASMTFNDSCKREVPEDPQEASAVSCKLRRHRPP